ncbi:hypothetical protein DB32_006580 [Sandaracinus amylolyticus]|uniref:Uncharacterized protein n=1 Tax=Sandaracinus amylolyticus TaxID=927083 RepID=A0A0F6W7F4_9BACT|nr:hypothetical protein DB32_006580 [Sandaracinus amylolyticus]
MDPHGARPPPGRDRGLIAHRAPASATAPHPHPRYPPHPPPLREWPPRRASC